jgi:methylenetetrahydrofolate reductase (NADPH)
MKVEIARNFSNKTQVGCKKFISQCFFDNEKFLEVADTIKKDYNDVELFAGIFPMLKFVQLDRLQNLSGCEIPEDTVKYFNAHKDDADAIYEFGIKQTAHQIIDLLKHGFNNIHFFTMADEKSTVEIMNEVLNA